MERVKWSNKHALDMSTHEILAQKHLTDFFQLFKATLSRERKNKTGCPTFLVLLESIQPRAVFVTVSHTKAHSHFPGLPHFSYTWSQGRPGLRDEDKAQVREPGSDTGASPQPHTTRFLFQTPSTRWLCLILQKCFPTILPSKFPNTSIQKTPHQILNTPQPFFFFFSCLPAPAEQSCPFAEISTLIH